MWGKQIQGERPPVGKTGGENNPPQGRRAKPRIKKTTVTQHNCTRTHFKCLYTNADSLINKLSEFQARVKANKCMVIGVTGVKPKNLRFLLNPAELALDGYNLYHSNITEDSRRGVILYIHKTLPALQLMTLNSRLKDSAWAEVKLNSHDTLLVGVIYRSPGSLDINNAKMQ